MAFNTKRGIRITSPFKLHAENLLDIREEVQSIADRNDLVTSHACPVGLRCYVRDTNATYVWNGSDWEEYAKIVNDKNIQFEMFGSTQTPAKVYGGDANGQGLSVGAGGTTIVASGEAKDNLESQYKPQDEKLVLASDTSIDVYTNANDSKNGFTIDEDLQMYPMENSTGSLGTTTNRYKDVFADNYTGTNANITNMTTENMTIENADIDNLVPHEDGTGNVGSASKRYKDVYGVNVHSTNGEITNVTSDKTVTNTLTSTDSTLTNATVENADIDSILPHSDNTGNIGASDRRYKNVYAVDVSAVHTNTTYASIEDATIKTAHPDKNESGSLGTSTNRYLDTYSKNVHATNMDSTNADLENVTSTNTTTTNAKIENADVDSMTPHENGTGTLGTTEKRYKDVYSKNVHASDADITNVTSENTTSTNITGTNITPPANGEGTIGTNDNRYGNVYSNKYTGTDADIDNVLTENADIDKVYPHSDNTGTLGKEDNRYATGYVTEMNSTDTNTENLTSTNATITNMTVENADFDTITPHEDSTGSVGTTDKRYKDVYAVDVTTTNVTAEKGDITNVNSTNTVTENLTSANTVPPEDGTGNIGSASKRYKDMYSVNVNATTVNATTGNITNVNSTNTVTENAKIENADVDSMTPHENGTGTLGTTDKRYKDVYAVDVTTTNVTAENGNITNVTSETTVTDSLTATDSNLTNVTSENTTSTNITGTNITPPTDGEGTLGSANKRYKDVYSQNVTATNGNIANVKSTDIQSTTAELGEVTSDNMHPSANNTGSLGSSTNRYKDVFSQNVTATNGSIDNVTSKNITSDSSTITDLTVTNETVTTVTPSATNTGSLGTSDKRFKDVFSQNVTATNGSITNVSSNKITPTGSNSTIGSKDNKFTEANVATGNIDTVNSTTVNSTNVNSTNGTITNVNTNKVTPTGENPSLGDATHKFKDTYSENVHATAIDATTGNITNVNSTTVKATTGNITTVNSTTVNSTNVNATTIAPTTNGSGSLGTADKSYKDVYGQNVHSTNVSATNGTITNVTTNKVIPSGTNPSLGDATHKFKDTYSENVHATAIDTNSITTKTITADTINATITGDVTGNLKGNADTATKLAAAQNINGTPFDGSKAITTEIWGTARNINIASSDGSGGSTVVSVNGSKAYTLLLPGTIKAALTGNVTGNVTGNATSANKVNNALTLQFNGAGGTTYDGSSAQTFNVTCAAIGALPLSGGTVTGTLVLSRTTDADGTTDVSPALIVGGTHNTAHIQIDNNEVLAKSNGTTPTTLNLNTNGGLVAVGGGGISVGNLTANYAIYADANKKLVPSATTSTELGYVHGVTSAIQTQLNAKLPLAGGTMTGDIKISKGGWSGSVITTYAGDSSGIGVTIQGGGRMIIGGGEAATSLRTALGTATSNEASEEMYIASDQSITFCTACQTIANRKTVTINTSGIVTAPGFSGPLTGNVTGNVSGSSGSCTGNAATATTASKTTATLTLQLNGGGTKTFNGSTAQTFNVTCAGIGALPLTGGTMTGQIQKAGVSSSWHKGRDVAAFRVSTIASYSPAFSLKTVNGSWEIGSYNASGYENHLLFTYITDAVYGGTTATTSAQFRMRPDGYIVGNVTGSSASCTGNAATATTASKTAQSLIIKLNGGTSEGSTQFTFNGSAAKTLSITAANIGAAASSHTHLYAGSSTAGGAATSLNYFKTTSTSNVGIDTTDANTVAYVSGLTALKLGFLANDGALYKQVYNASWVHEIYGDYRTGQIQVRGKNNGTWQALRTVLDSVNYKTYCTPTNIGAAASSHSHSNYLPLAGGTMTGDIKITRGAYTASVITTYAGDSNGFGVTIQGGGRMIIGSGESATNLRGALGTAATNETSEEMYIASDNTITFCTACQTVANRKTVTINTSGIVTAPGFSGPLTGNVTGNVSGSSGSCTGNATTATTATTANQIVLPNGTIMFTTSSDANFFKAKLGGTWEVTGQMAMLTGTAKSTIYIHKKTA